MNDDYIRRETVVDSLNKLCDRVCQYSKAQRYVMCSSCPLGDADIVIEAIPAADVRPVVLCRECDHWNEWDHVGRESLGNFRCSCAYWSNEDCPTYYTSENDFCSYGERREGGADR